MSKKIDIINTMYSQLRISGLTVQPTPESVQAALERLEGMMAELETRTICLGYNFEEAPNPDSETNVDHAFNNMMHSNLAIRMMPDFNKQPNPTLIAQANQSMSVASAYAARNNLHQTPYPNRQPIGGANTLRYNWWRRYYREEKPIKTDCSNKEMLIGEINDYYEDFHTFLEGDSIQSFTATITNGIEISNTAINNERIDYRIEAVSSSESNYQRVTITITTANGRVNTRIVNFNVTSPAKAFI